MNNTTTSTPGDIPISPEDVMLDKVWEVIASILTIVANLFLLAVEGRTLYKRREISQPKQLVVFLASVDLLCTLLGVIPEWTILLTKPCQNSSYMAMFLLTRFCLNWLIALSKCIVVLMSIERVLAFNAPFFYVRHVTLKLLCISEAVVLAYTLLISIVVLVMDIKSLKKFRRTTDFNASCSEVFVKFEYPYHVELLKNGTSSYSLTYIIIEVQDVILTGVLILCNLMVVHGLHQMNKKLITLRPQPDASTTTGASTRSGSGQELSRLMIAIGLTDILLTLPYTIRVIHNHMGVYRSNLADMIARRLNLSISFANPLLYGFMKGELRRLLFRIFVRSLHFQRNNNIEPIGLDVHATVED